ncbi:MAG: hypothetical protein ABR587_12375 [Candidatus Binatia bacterium]
MLSSLTFVQRFLRSGCVTARGVKRSVAGRMCAAVVLAAMASDATAEPLVALGTLGGTESTALSINNAGQVAGHAELANGEFHAFLYSGGAMTDLGALASSDHSSATAINEAGQVVGRMNVPGGTHAFLYDNGIVTDLGTLGGWLSDAAAINDAGQVVGWSLTSETARAFLYEDGAMSILGMLGTSSFAIDINNAGQVAGDFITEEGDQHAFLYSNGVMTDLGTLGGNESHARAMNEAGQVVGDSLNAAGERRPFFYSSGVMTDIGSFGSTSGLAQDINDAGQVVGTSTLAGETMGHAFLYSANTMTDLGTLWGTHSGATAINNSGQVTGWVSSGAGTVAKPFLYSDGLMFDLGSLPGNARTYTTDINDAGQVVGYAQGLVTVWAHAFFTPCPLLPATTCFAGTKSSLLVKDGPFSRDSVRWKWSGGPEIVQADLGNPAATTSYRACMYDSTAGVDSLVTKLEINPTSAWSNESPRGWTYRDRSASEDGVQQLQLTAGQAGRTRVRLGAKGPGIPMPAAFSSAELFDQNTQVTIQLFNDATSACWTSAFPSSIVNTATRFKAKTP